MKIRPVQAVAAGRAQTRDFATRSALSSTTALNGSLRRALAGLVPAIAAGALLVSADAFAQVAPNTLPTGSTVQAGTVTITQPDANKLQITQGSDKAIIDWKGYSIGSQAWVNYTMPGAGSVSLNRVTGGDVSHIMGKLTANGTVMLINPNGILFGKGSIVDVGGLVATTANIRNDDFMAGRMHFTQPGNPGGTVINEGQISIKQAGVAAFVAPGVANHGVIEAKLGTVSLAGANTFTLDLYGDGLVKIAVTDPVTVAALGEGKPLVSNTGTINADGGKVLITAAAAKGLVDTVINMDGVVQARRVTQSADGTIVLDGGANGTVNVAGKLDVSATGTGVDAGKVTVTGEKVRLRATANINATAKIGKGGTVKIGGDFQGQGPTPQAKIVVIDAGALINVSATDSGDGGLAVVWSTDTTTFNGIIMAKGGELAGNGGLVETSGHYLAVGESAVIDTGAPKGTPGTWLLDPATIDIGDAGDATIAACLAQPVTCNITVTVLQNALSAGNVTLTASGTINVKADVTYTGANILTLIIGTAGAQGTLAFESSDSLTISHLVLDSPRTSGLGINITYGNGSSGFRFSAAAGTPSLTLKTDIAGVQISSDASSVGPGIVNVSPVSGQTMPQIVDAVAFVASGGTINVAAGTYNINNIAIGKEVHILGVGSTGAAATSTIFNITNESNPDDGLRFNSSADNSSVKDIRFKHEPSASGSAIVLDGSGGTLSGMTLELLAFTNSNNAILYKGHVSELSILNNKFGDSANANIGAFTGDSAITFSSSTGDRATSWQIKNNLFDFSNGGTRTVINLTNATGTSDKHFIIDGNTIVNGTVGISLQIDQSADDAFTARYIDITNNSIDVSSGSSSPMPIRFFIDLDGSSDNQTNIFKDVVISGNTLKTNTSASGATGISFGWDTSSADDDSTARYEDFTISRNLIEGRNGILIATPGSSSPDTEIKDFIVAENRFANDFLGIDIRDLVSGDNTFSFLIRNNYFDGSFNTAAIRINSGSSGSQVKVLENSFSTFNDGLNTWGSPISGFVVDNNGSGTVQLEKNWFGTDNSATIATKLDGTVNNVTPLGHGTDGDPVQPATSTQLRANGFQPGNSLIVTILYIEDIQYWINTVAPGSELVIAAGVYALDNPSPTYANIWTDATFATLLINKNVTIRGPKDSTPADGTRFAANSGEARLVFTTATGSNLNAITIASSNVTLNGFQIEVDGAFNAALAINNTSALTNIDFNNNIIKSVGTNVLNFGVTTLGSASIGTGSTFTGNYFASIGASPGTGLYMAGASGITFSGNTFSGIADDGTNALGFVTWAEAGRGIVLENGSGNTISGNTYTNVSVAIALLGTETGTTVTQALADFTNVRAYWINNAGTDLSITGLVKYADAVSIDGLSGTSKGRFSTIQNGINFVAPGGVVTATAGTFIEFLDIWKPLTLNGNNDGIAWNGARNPETIVAPPNDNISATPDVLITIRSDVSNVTIDGLTLEGRVNATGSNTASNIIEIGVRGSFTTGGNAIVIANNLFKNFQQYGIDLDGGGSTVKTGLDIHHNSFTAMGPSGGEAITAIRLVDDIYGYITSNYITNALDVGIRVEDYQSGSSYNELKISYNKIELLGNDIGIDFARIGGSGTFRIYNNTIDMDGSDSTGIKIVDVDDSARIKVKYNTIWVDSGTGISVYNVWDSAYVKIKGNRIDVDDEGTGIKIEKVTDDATIKVKYNTITGDDETYGIRVNDVSGDAYIKIKGNDIELGEDSYGVKITNVRDDAYISVKSNTIDIDGSGGDSWGIYVDGVNDDATVKIKYNTIWVDSETGIGVYNVDDHAYVKIAGNRIDVDSYGTGIDVDGVWDYARIKIKYNDIIGDSDAIGIRVDDLSGHAYVKIKGNDIGLGSDSIGIKITDVSDDAYISVKRNTIDIDSHWGSPYGIYVENVNDDAYIKIKYNKIWVDEGTGIGIYTVDDDTRFKIAGNRIDVDSHGTGIDIDGVRDNAYFFIGWNKITGDYGATGIRIDDAYDVTDFSIYRNRIELGSGSIGIKITDVADYAEFEIKKNTIDIDSWKKGGIGIYIEEVDDKARFDIAWNTIWIDGGYGIKIRDVSDWTSFSIVGNRIDVDSFGTGIKIADVWDGAKFFIGWNEITGDWFSTGIKIENANGWSSFKILGNDIELGPVSTGIRIGNVDDYTKFYILGNKIDVDGWFGTGIMIYEADDHAKFVIAFNKIWVDDYSTGIKIKDVSDNTFFGIFANKIDADSYGTGISITQVYDTPTFLIWFNKISVDDNGTGVYVGPHGSEGQSLVSFVGNYFKVGTDGTALLVDNREGTGGYDIGFRFFNVIEGPDDAYYGVKFLGLNLNLIGDTFGNTVFKGAAEFYIHLTEGALFAPGNPTLIDVSAVDFDGLILGVAPSQANIAIIEARAEHYLDNGFSGLLFPLNLTTAPTNFPTIVIPNFDLPQWDPNRIFEVKWFEPFQTSFQWLSGGPYNFGTFTLNFPLGTMAPGVGDPLSELAPGAGPEADQAKKVDDCTQSFMGNFWNWYQQCQQQGLQ